MTNSNGNIHFGTDILPLFALLALFVALLSVHLLFVRLGASGSELVALDAPTTAVGGLTSTYIFYIIARVVVLTRRGGKDDGG